ncbi:hypothetical protein BURMUCF1_0518 [Burkholderia multivorans ATCC BAA-247]|jgi:hypothetical protein|nr:hypothetical protein BURMUCF2_0535 [Burkholderia multivorans CF2]EJO53538.1 hypothetical protein BURMUCF1_0518 [Burkholderia multivorans ATCC BAA-247]
MTGIDRFSDTRDFDFPQPAPFLRLTDTLFLLNNRLQIPKTL